MTARIDFDAVNAAALRSARSLLPDLVQGGTFNGNEYVARNPVRNDNSVGSFSINHRTGVWKDFATGDGGSDLISLYAYVRGTSQGDSAKMLADMYCIKPLNGGTTHKPAPPTRTAPNEIPRVYSWGEDGPAKFHDEIRRHAYLNSDGAVAKYKIKLPDRWSTVYRVFKDGKPIGWQRVKPDCYVPIPYITKGTNPFDLELRGDLLLWAEGERDTDTLAKAGLPAFTFGGVGDGLTDDVTKAIAERQFLVGRHVVILADNDSAGRTHAEKKAAFARTAGAASIKIVQFSELPPKGDVSDFIENGGTAELLQQRIDDTPVLQETECGAPDHLNSDDEVTKVNAPPSQNEAAEPRLIMRCMADIEPEQIEWLWRGRIAIGKQTLIGGEPGLGKSQVTAALAAAVTTGGLWPCDEGRAPHGSVIILSAEDDAGDTIRPRLDAAGADVRSVHLISAVGQSDGQGRRTFNLQADLSLLEQAIERLGDVRLVIIDPVSSYLGKTDSHKNADVRGTLEPLGDMASRLRVAIVSITHFSKGAGQSAVNSFIGSIAFVAAARAAFIVTPDPEDNSRRLFVQAKNNLAGDSGGLAYRIAGHLVGINKDIVASAIVWDGEKIARTADDILAANREGNDRPERSEAEDFLRDILSNGPRPSTDIEDEAKGAGISWRTVRRAQQTLGIKPHRKAESGDGLGRSGRWYWALPSGSDEAMLANFPYDVHVQNVDALGEVGHLRGDGGGHE